MCAVTRFRYIGVLFHIVYYYPGENIVCYTEDFVTQKFVKIEVPLSYIPWLPFVYIAVDELGNS